MLLSLLLSVNSMIPYVRVGVWCRVGWGLVGCWLVDRLVGWLGGLFWFYLFISVIIWLHVPEGCK